ncbi:MAG: hypothetical protein RIQ59_508 [Bacteroidota bacterium]|jgi:hypothetical protein
MKNYLQKTIQLFILIIGLTAFAQVPQKMTYQSVIRNTNGDLITNTSIGIQISILKDSPTGQAVYVETMSNTTNENGLLTLEIGGGTPVTGTFAAINWATGTFFVKTETDPTGGTNYSIVGVGQLLSVPYALFSGKSTNLGKSTIYLTDDITDAEAAAQIEEEAGTNTENVIIENTTVLTTVDLSKIKTLLSLTIFNNHALSSINFSNLKKTYKDIAINNNPLLASLSFPSLEKSTSGIFAITNNNVLSTIQFPLLNSLIAITIETNPALSTINFDSLTKSTSQISINNNNLNAISFPAANNIIVSITDTHTTTLNLPLLNSGAINTNCPLTTLNAPAITNCYISINNSQLTTLDFPNLTTSSVVELQNNNLLTNVSLPNLASVDAYFYIVSNPLLNAITIPSINSINPNFSNFSFYFNVTNNALPESQINYLLNKLASVNINTGKTIDLSNQNPAAVPTGQGIIDKQTLVNSGFLVITD